MAQNNVRKRLCCCWQVVSSNWSGEFIRMQEHSTRCSCCLDRRKLHRNDFWLLDFG